MASHNKAKSGQLRIIAGQWRGRKLSFPSQESLRPTPDRVRETLFNWLQTVVTGSQCLDLFAGSGALGFEAASRGANRVLMLEQDGHTVSALRQNVKLLEASQVEVRAGDVLTYLKAGLDTKARPYDLVFIDPPYRLGLVPACCQLLESEGWLSEGARIYLECDADELLENIPQQWHCLKSKKAGQVGYYLYGRNSEQGR